MAVDTAAKRFAMLGFASQVVALIIIDAAVSTEDRVSWIGLYNGITLTDVTATAYDPRSPFRVQRDIIPFLLGGAG